jgi:hypothetical protein
MKREEIYFDLENTEYAKSLNELSQEQLLAVFRIFRSSVSLARKTEQLVGVVCNTQPHQHLYIVEDDYEAVVGFLFDNENLLTTNQLPVISNGWFSKLYGPGEKMQSSNFGEFMMADSFCTNYLKTQDITWLHKMIACLYRPKKKNYNPKAEDFDGDIREKFNSNNLESRLKVIAKLKLDAKDLILNYFVGCKNQFAKSYTELFVREESGGAKGEESSWFLTLRRHADDITKFSQVMEANADLILFDMNQKQIDAKKLQEHYDSLK